MCTKRVHTQKEIKAKKKKILAKEHTDHIHILYGIDTSQDQPSVHPQYICTEYHIRIVHSLQSGHKGPNEAELNLDGIYGQQKQRMKGKNIWCEHSDHCAVCDLYEQQSKPGLVKKTATPGRPKQKTEELLFNVNGHVFCRTTIHMFMPEEMEFVEADDRDLCMCPICLDALSEQSVNTGCHHFCALCLLIYYNAKKQNILPCPVCDTPIHVHDVTPISDHLLLIINKVHMKCETCGISGRLHEMRSHFCDSIPEQNQSDDTTDDNRSHNR